eukprot:GHRQ01005497.1.p1 GENE.GHRQ01005497.1~~GHRQ01005497.1.p1  ORF type:complete len:460 (+),score=179.43 GHRQ01005497.1:61-1440(+)
MLSKTFLPPVSMMISSHHGALVGRQAAAYAPVLAALGRLVVLPGTCSQAHMQAVAGHGASSGPGQGVLPEVQHDAAASTNETSIRAVLEGLLQKQAAAVAADHQFPGMVGQEDTSYPAARSGTLGQHLQQEQQQAAAVARAQQQCTAFPGHQPDSAQVRMESQLIFGSCWRRFKEKHGMDFTAPREIVWLNGAPGSGKGVSTPLILKARGMSRSVCVSSLLTSAREARKYIDAGEMMPDHVVGNLLLEALLLPASAGHGAAGLNLVVDGFPRTAVQVDFVKLLMDKLRYLHTQYIDTPLATCFPRPAFKVVMLYVDEDTSVNRQLQRAVAAQAHNKRVVDAGLGEQQLHEERSTDALPEKASKRYQIFKQHYSAILRLKQFFPFHLIDACGSPAETQEQIRQELRYQSSLDLSEEAYSAIRWAAGRICSSSSRRTARVRRVRATRINKKKQQPYAWRQR